MKADDIDDPLCLLEKLGYLRGEGLGSGPPRSGRPASQRFEVNPAWLADATP